MRHNNIFKISREFSGTRLDRALQSLTGLSRKKIKQQLDQGNVFVNQRKVIIASWELKEGDQVRLEKEELLPSTRHYFLKVPFEDDHLIVVEKEPGIACEKSPISTKPTLVAIINSYFQKKQPHLQHHYLGLVHRLDQETSGLMVYTKTKEANRITDQFKRHTIKRKYRAVVEGRVEKNEGEIFGYLKKSSLLPGGKKVVLSTPESGVKARTNFQVLERYAHSTLLEITLNTGRTHQIRVHLSSIGHPVMGDKIYGTTPPTFSRQALHASFLGFHHPVTGKKIFFHSDLPKDLKKLVTKLQITS